ncbi:SusD/RagB family nutrient-binding outer membrane lipoprotein [Apibacter raozihei]|uniref:SusD/RagB family nutrient-binding outer membrane lipoprotein n=1 Tax=Apibacter TaxID=1778601 RepID=UPI000FE30D27|nr:MULTISPECIES: SusD/RagB family nutrient-binding outer membrane lipoprotein [Apibacter]
MKKIITYITSIVMLSCTISCDNDFENINKNPNQPEKVPGYTTFSFGTRYFVDNTRDEWGSGRMVLPWVQYWAQNNYTEEDRYQYREGSNSNLWKSYYMAANNIKQSILLVEADPEANSLYGAPQNQIAAARIMLSYIFMQLTDTYGNVPYWSYGGRDNSDFQALQVALYKTPKFATQEIIYTDILKELKEASLQLDVSKTVSTGDNIYKGNALKWKKFANSLRLRIANRLKEVLPDAQTEINNALSEGVFTSNDDNAILSYGTSSQDANPMWYAYFVNNRTDFNVANTFVDLLKGKLGNFGPDPRLQKFVSPKSASITDVKNNSYTSSTNVDDYEGMPYGVNSAMATEVYTASTISFPSYDILNISRGEVLMEYAEVQFILSELTGWSDSYYKAGVQASLEKWGVSSADITTYVSALPAVSQENVLTQKYIALYMQPHEAWAEYRRTGYPKTLLLPNKTYTLPANPTYPTGTVYTFTSLVSGMTDLPTRIPYPTHLATQNTVNYNEAIKQMGGNDMKTVKLIWDKN